MIRSKFGQPRNERQQRGRGDAINAVERLRRDHDILRSKLNVLEAALGMGRETWFVLRELSFTLARQLRDHIGREEALVAACRQALSPTTLADITLEHREEPRHLRAINRLFVSEGPQAFDRVRPALSSVIDGLRRHMAEEEQELFPIFEGTLSDQEAATSHKEATMHPLNEAMTVNRIVQEYPDTERVFRQLLINIPYEGCACLDELAWRHGMDSDELIARLEQAIEADRPSALQSLPSEQSSCACSDRA